MLRTRPALAVLAVTTGLAAAVLPALPAQATVSAPPLVFSSDRDGDTDLYLRAPDGGLTRLTDNDANDFAPAWSPDGSRLAFVSDRDGDDEVFVMAADGSGVRQLTRNTTNRDGGPAVDQAPRWSPDGRSIVFASNRSGGETEIWSMRSNGTRQLRLTRTAPYVLDHTPSWSPDGTRIAFASNRAGFENVEIYTMDVRGRDVRRLTTTGDTDDNAPQWSPDGTHLVFSSNRAGQQDIWVMRADGTQPRLLTGDPGLDDVFPRWTADGSQVVFSTFAREGVRDADVWVVGRDGSGRTALTGQGSDDIEADPRPGPSPADR
jgi:TolB protein